MKKLKGLAAVATSLSIAATMYGCTPTIGEGTQNAMNIDGYDVRSGVFIYYTMQAFEEASSMLSEQNGEETLTVNDVKNSNIDGLDTSDWIQDKATEYCEGYVTIQKEFEKTGSELSPTDLDEIDNMASYYYNMDSRYSSNGITEDTIREIAASTYKEQAVFEYYYNFDGEKGCSEEELKDYFDENFARVKYFQIDLTNDEGELLSEDEQRKLRKMAEDYAKRINSKKTEYDKMTEFDVVSGEYDEYVAAQAAETAEESEDEEEAVVTATAGEEESEETTTTTADPYESERLMQKQTTAAEEENDETATTTTESESSKNSRLFNEYLFNDITLDKAEVYDYSDETIYVVLRGDLRERMTDDGYWSEDYISNLQQLRYYDEFVDYMDGLSDNMTTEKNNSSYRRYAPFKLELEEA